FFREGVEDLKLVRETLSAGQGRLVDEEGIDWWNLTALLIAPQVEAMLTWRRVAAQIPARADLWATRAGWPGNAIAFLLGGEVQTFSGSVATRLARRVGHYGGVFHRFSAAQVEEIFLDKYDRGYEWRSRC